MFRDILKNSCSGKEDYYWKVIIIEKSAPKLIVQKIGIYFFKRLGEQKIMLFEFLRFALEICG